VPLLFAATLFVSASLLFMVQPMVGKMVLPLLGGSPAVWNACMVFFQLLLLLGYQYAHFVTGRYPPRKQWAIHMLALGLPLAAFALAVIFGVRNSPIAIAESLAPSGDSSPVLSVLALLTVAIAIPFFIVSTSAPLLQKWFTATNHPSARDPYFLYSASNAGSLISLLGYPIFIEPYLGIVGQAWLFAGGFVLLCVMIFFCGRAAANPIGAPPPSVMAQNAGSKWAKSSGNANGANANANSPAQSSLPASEPPPALMRKLKWIALAFVPSSLMLGVTFYMTTDIASVPLLWVVPLALYLVTFIISFGRVPDWFRIVIGNLAPVMILLLVFVMISGVNTGFFITLLLHILTFFSVALMCHYELARDRPSPQYLTEFFLLMSVGGVLGGIFNSLLAPILFTYPFEYKIVLLVACLLVPVLTDEEDTAKDDASKRTKPPAPDLGNTGIPDWLPVAGVIANAAIVLMSLPLLYAQSPEPSNEGEKFAIAPMALWVVGGLLLAGIASVGLIELYGRRKFKQSGLASQLWSQLPTPLKIALLVFVNPLALPWATVAALRGTGLVQVYLDIVVAILVGVTYYFLRQLPGEGWFNGNGFNGAGWFGKLVVKLVETLNIAATTVVAVLISAVPVMLCFFFVDRPLRFALSVTAILAYSTYREEANTAIYAERSFFGILKIQETERATYVHSQTNADEILRWPETNKPIIGREFILRRLTHGTTLHGTQFTYPDTPDGRLLSRDFWDDFKMISPSGMGWDSLVTAGVIQTYDIRQEPLTYYHRTGPVGAMFTELRTRKNGTDSTAPYAMIGLGTGSVSCYARRGQSLTFYEIDTAVKRLVADTDRFFTYVTDARNRGANLDIRLGDARLVLKRDTDRKYTLLLVDAFSSDSIPVHLLTKEAVELYLDRLTDDGILAIHISNRWIRLEPVVSAIANRLGLAARVWNDEAEGHPGKTASSWIVLARKQEHLGNLFTPAGDLPFPLTPEKPGEERQRFAERHTMSGRIGRYLMDLPVNYILVEDYPELEEIGDQNRPKYVDLNLSSSPSPTEAWLAWSAQKFSQVSDPDGSQRLAVFRDVKASGGGLTDYLAAYRAWFDQKYNKPANTEAERVKLCMELIRRHGLGPTLTEVMVREHGHAFRRLETLAQVPAWTDDYSDVLRVMGLPELQRVRKFFGLPTPVER
jgi:hypothetical protein